MCTPPPVSAFKYAGRTATKVFPSPVFISAILPSCKDKPPIIWTSKRRLSSVRFIASLTRAKASGNISSRVSVLLLDLFNLSLNSNVFLRKSLSSNFEISTSKALILDTIFSAFLMNLELSSPNILLYKLINIY